MEIGTLVLFTTMLATVLGFIGGFAISIIFLIPRKAGTLHVDMTDTNKPKYLFEIDELDKIADKKKVTLTVNGNANLSSK